MRSGPIEKVTSSWEGAEMIRCAAEVISDNATTSLIVVCLVPIKSLFGRRKPRVSYKFRTHHWKHSTQCMVQHFIANHCKNHKIKIILKKFFPFTRNFFFATLFVHSSIQLLEIRAFSFSCPGKESSVVEYILWCVKWMTRFERTCSLGQFSSHSSPDCSNAKYLQLPPA